MHPHIVLKNSMHCLSHKIYNKNFNPIKLPNYNFQLLFYIVLIHFQISLFQTRLI